MKKAVAQIVVGLPVEGPFDYSINRSMSKIITLGERVLVPFGPRNLIGYVVGFKNKSTFKHLKPIQRLIDKQSILDSNLLKLASQLSGYYCCSLGAAIETSLPTALKKGKEINLSNLSRIKKINKKRPEIILLHDQGREKRWPYLCERIKSTVEKKQGVIFLVPEVSLIGYVRDKLRTRLCENISVLDKRLSPNQELKEWIKVKSGKTKIVIGTRSAIFAPLKNMGLIIIYDDENTAYKQEQSPHYHAREIALMRSKIDKCSVIFTGTTPSAKIWWMAKKKEIKLCVLKEKYLSEMQVVNMLNYNIKRSSFISVPLRNSMEKVLKDGGRAVLFMNRKGFSTLARCTQCGHTLKCERCDVNLTYLYAKKKMVCRYCNYHISPPNICPKCNSTYLRYTGVGIEKLESEVSRIFPQANVSHYDKDTKEIPKDVNIIIATQAILKRHPMFYADLVSVVNLDSELNRVDFRSGEKTFSLLIHLRHLAKQKLIVQTRLPDNYCLKSAKKMDFEKFYKEEIKLRKELYLPPFSHLISIMMRGRKEDAVFKEAGRLYHEIQSKGKNIEVIEPQPDIIPKLRGTYRFRVLVKTKSVKKIMPFIQSVVKLFKKKSGIIISIDVE